MFSRRAAVWYAAVLAAILASIALGFVLTWDGPFMWDDVSRYRHSQWLLGRYGFATTLKGEAVRYYAPLWELLLGIATNVVFAPLQDPYWVRHALTFALYPLGMGTLFLLLRRAGISKAGCCLAVAILLGHIRLGGHALFNMKDFPGALAYLLATVGLWVLLREAAKRQFPRHLLAGMGMVAVIPYLVRSPLLLHAGLILLLLPLLALMLRDKALRLSRRVDMVIIPSLAAIAFAVAVSPSLWTPDAREWIRPLTYFADYPYWNGVVRFMGMQWPAEHLPRWYPLAWLPVGIHPLALLLAVNGIVPGVLHARKIGLPLQLRMRWGTARLPLAMWVWLIVLTSWITVLAVHPKLYDEDRHILFLLPVTYLAGALGLEVLQSRVKYALAALIVLASGYGYWTWGTYAYVYKSPIIVRTGARDFLGDYWSTCVSDAVHALKGRVPPHTPVQVIGSTDVASIQLGRLQKNGPWHDPAFGPYPLSGAQPPKSGPPYARIVINRNNRDLPSLKQIRDGTAELLWQQVMPPGDAACSLLLITGPRPRTSPPPRP